MVLLFNVVWLMCLDNVQGLLEFLMLERRCFSLQEYLMLVLLADGEMHSTTSLARRVRKRTKDVLYPLLRAKGNGLVRCYLRTRSEGNWWQLTEEGTRVLLLLLEASGAAGGR